MQFVKPLPAATIVLVRDTDDTFELFLQKRNSATSFGGLYVFPGGKVNKSDTLLKQEGLISGLTPEDADNKLNLASDGIDYWIAAVRECFEEAGFLLAYNDTGELIDFADQDIRARFTNYRNKINSKQLEFYQMCSKERLSLALDLIYPIGHWITPEGSPYRYDTRFFIARAPDGQEGSQDDYEATDSVWFTPQEAVSRYSEGTLPLILPTIDTIDSLVPFKSAEEAISHNSGYVPGHPRSFF
jgi:8-oxo-dGTP pyrophosphatase MutT (NUDIX family)